MNWTFEKFVGDCAINSQFVAKYVTSTGRVKLVVEDKETDTERGERIFFSCEEYESFLDRVTNDDWVYNGGRVVNDIINALV